MDMAGGGSEPSLSLFGQADGTGEEEGWDEAELLRHEKEALGFYITGSPLMKYKKALELFNVKGISALEGIPDKQQASTAGMIASLKKMRTRGKAELMAYLTLEDDEGTVEVIVFPELYKAHAELLKKDAPLFVSGTLDRPAGHSDKEGAAAPGEIKIIARELSSLDELLSNGNNRPGFSRVEIRINSRNPDLKALRDLLAGNSGGMPLYLRIAVGDAEAIIQTSFGVQPSVPLMEGVENFLGKGAVKVV